MGVAGARSPDPAPAISATQFLGGGVCFDLVSVGTVNRLGGD